MAVYRQQVYRKEYITIKRTYWPTLVALTVRLVRYYQLHQASLPTDLPPSVSGAFTQLANASTDLITYDKSKAGGRYDA